MLLFRFSIFSIGCKSSLSRGSSIVWAEISTELWKVAPMFGVDKRLMWEGEGLLSSSFSSFNGSKVSKVEFDIGFNELCSGEERLEGWKTKDIVEGGWQLASCFVIRIDCCEAGALS